MTPLAVPMMSGPGAIATTILLHNKAEGLAQQAALFGCIVGVCVASYWILRIAAATGRFWSPIAMRIATRLMGLLLAAIAFQFLLNAMMEIKKTL